jgi:hypothetical protein
MTGVWYVQLPAVHYGLHSEQPTRTVTLDCPGVDTRHAAQRHRLWARRSTRGAAGQLKTLATILRLSL